MVRKKKKKEKKKMKELVLSFKVGKINIIIFEKCNFISQLSIPFS